MSEPFIAEIRMFAADLVPTGWARCDGSLLLVAQQASLASLIGSTFGGWRDRLNAAAFDQELPDSHTALKPLGRLQPILLNRWIANFERPNVPRRGELLQLRDDFF